MTIRAKKSEVDAFANGKLSLDGFRKQIDMKVCAGGVVGESDNLAVFGYSGPNGVGGASGAAVNVQMRQNSNGNQN